MKIYANFQEVLKSLPFDKVNIDIILVETQHIINVREVEPLLASKGYEKRTTFGFDHGKIVDTLFVKKTLTEKLKNQY